MNPKINMALLNGFFTHFSQDLGIDLGTANTFVYAKGRGIVIQEPSTVAVNTRTDEIIAVGITAKEMLGKTPPHIVVTKPLVDGVISDFEITEKMLRFIIDQVHQRHFALLPRPQVVMSIPLGVTEVEKKAVEDAARGAGARVVHLLEEPMAAALGSRLPVRDSRASLILDIGGGTTQIAVIALGGIVNWKTLRLAGDEMNRNLSNFVRDEFGLLVGERTAEDLKIELGAALKDADMPRDTTIRGRDVVSGLPREVTITAEQVRGALNRTIALIIDEIKATLEETPPELVADIYQTGMVVVGGGALLKGLAERIAKQVHIPVTIAEDPLTAVVRGTGIVIEDIDSYRDLIAASTQDERRI